MKSEKIDLKQNRRLLNRRTRIIDMTKNTNKRTTISIKRNISMKNFDRFSKIPVRDNIFARISKQESNIFEKIAQKDFAKSIDSTNRPRRTVTKSHFC